MIIQPKDVSTERITRLGSELQEGDMPDFFKRDKLLARPDVFPCPSTSDRGAPLTITVTPRLPSDARKARTQDLQLLKASSVCMGRDSMAFAVLATSGRPFIE